MRSKLVLLIALTAAALLVSAPGPQFSPEQKAFYASQRLINFVRPGLVIKVLSGEVGTDGTIRARVKITDPRGLPLEREGVTTPGPVAMSFIASYIPAGQTQQVSYTTRVQRSPLTNVSATQAAADSGGVFRALGDGEYEYTFRTRAPAGFEAASTHTIGVYGSRNLSEFDLPTNYDDDVFHFVPAGGAVSTTRDVVRTETCNRCHETLAMHGGARRSVELCAQCHTPQTIDPDTGNTLDLIVMTHKIHAGADLPSVKAGKPYQIIGFNQSVLDYSKVKFPSDVRNCAACHESNAKQSGNMFKPSRAACGSCHDDVNFATGEGHLNLPQISDNQCATCHTQQGELDFDASILGAHTIATKSRHLPGTVFELLEVSDGVAGKRPTVTFTIKDKTGKAILPSEMTRLALVLAGPTADYSKYISEDARRAEGGNGLYYWTFAQPLPEDTKGSYTIGIEGYRNIILLEGTKQQQTVRDAGSNKVMHFAVDGSKLEPRRQIVTTEKCNACHSKLSLHGESRNSVEQCVLCHNANLTDQARRPASAGAPETVDFRVMIHRIHTGEELTREYSIYGFGSTKIDFSHLLYPQDRRNCAACHVNGSEQVQQRANMQAVPEMRGPIGLLQPTTAACTGCHTSMAAASHAMANTTRIGESCAACHGPNADFSVTRVHAR